MHLGSIHTTNFAAILAAARRAASKHGTELSHRRLHYLSMGATSSAAVADCETVQYVVSHLLLKKIFTSTSLVIR